MKTTMKRITLVIMSFIMTLVMCVSAYADHLSSWLYCTRAGFENYGTRAVMDEDAGIVASTWVNFSGRTYSIVTESNLCTYYSEDSETDPYYHYTETNTLETEYGATISDSTRKNILTLSTDPIDYNTDEEMMHSYAYAYTMFCDYGALNEIDWVYTWVNTHSEEIYTLDHVAGQCEICDRMLGIPESF